jgi:exo-1,4-beta-D-glucosaminidase
MVSAQLVRYASFSFIFLAAISTAKADALTDASTSKLGDNWRMQSAAAAADDGAVISKGNYAAKDWYPISVPTTVLAGLVANSEYPQLLEADNLKKVPEARFQSPWWFRREFAVPAGAKGRRVAIEFKGINYRADVWINGHPIASSTDLVGTYRNFEYYITGLVRSDVPNVLAVRVFPPDPKKDLAITFVDWAPAPPDHNMGLWQDVVLHLRGPVAVRRPFVQTDLPVPARAPARLTIETELTNSADEAVTGTLTAKIDSLQVSQNVTLAAHETRVIAFTPEAFPQLVVAHPRLWWPWQLGRPELYGIDLSFAIDQHVSDQITSTFGIRRVDSRLQQGRLLFSINGVDLLILGGGYAPDLLQRRVLPGRPDWQEEHLLYLRNMNLNTVRLEGKLEDDAFYDLCDRHGILVMAGWCCCSPWEQWNKWQPEQHAVARSSLRYQIERARTHPSMLAWLNGSDHHPPPEIERDYLAIEKELRWPCPLVSSATAALSEVTGPSGVKMEGPYKWEPPIFWTTDRKTGGAWGFNTEVGPGAVPPPLESLEAMLPAEHRWPIDAIWEFHAGGGTFKKITDFTDALDHRFGPSRGIADFSWKSQAQAYETIRAMYEAFRRNKFEATGEIQWMMNNAWPSTIWHLYDYYFRPGAAYFATKVACEPVHLLYGYDNTAISLVNDSETARDGLEAIADVYDINGKLRGHQATACAITANASKTVFTLPTPADISSTYFVRLTLRGPAHEVIGVNSYWLPTTPDVLGENGGKESWNITPCKSYADYTALETLPRVALTLGAIAVSPDGDEQVAHVTVTNESNAVAMLVRLKLSRGEGGDEVLPIRWDDNYFMLLPGESRSIGARYASRDLGAARPVVSVDCYNNGREPPTKN